MPHLPGLAILFLVCSSAFGARTLALPPMGYGFNFPYASTVPPSTTTGLIVEYLLTLRNASEVPQTGRLVIDSGVSENAVQWNNTLTVGRSFYGCSSANWVQNNVVPTGRETEFTLGPNGRANVRLGVFYWTTLPSTGTAGRGIGVNFDASLTLHVDQDRGAVLGTIKTIVLCPTGTLCTGNAVAPWNTCPDVPSALGYGTMTLLNGGRPF